NFFDVDTQLNEKLKKFSALTSELEEFNKIAKNKTQEHTERITKEKQEYILEKIKRGEKLTNDDLIVFQGS
ncbi:MAG: hypothetical protein AABY14_02045, partial [Nanoarchaeota archaeon]